jgi:hypothetical protein
MDNPLSAVAKANNDTLIIPTVCFHAMPSFASLHPCRALRRAGRVMDRVHRDRAPAHAGRVTARCFSGLCIETIPRPAPPASRACRDHSPAELGSPNPSFSEIKNISASAVPSINPFQRLNVPTLNALALTFSRGMNPLAQLDTRKSFIPQE